MKSRYRKLAFEIFYVIQHTRTDIFGWVWIFELSSVCTEQNRFRLPKIQVEFPVLFRNLYVKSLMSSSYHGLAAEYYISFSIQRQNYVAGLHFLNEILCEQIRSG